MSRQGAVPRGKRGDTHGGVPQRAHGVGLRHVQHPGHAVRGEEAVRGAGGARDHGSVVAVIVGVGRLDGEFKFHREDAVGVRAGLLCLQLPPPRITLRPSPFFRSFRFQLHAKRGGAREWQIREGKN